MPPASVGPDRRTDAGRREPAVTSFRDNSRRLQLLAVTASLSLFAGGATPAHAEGEPPPTTTEPTTTMVAPPPAPEGSFGWELAGKPPVRHEKPVVPSPSTGTPTPAVTTTTTTASSSPRPVRPRVKPKPRQKPASPVPHVVRPRRTGAVLAAETTGAGDSATFVLTVAALSLAIACFALGSLPSAQVRWRRGAAFVAYRRTDVTVVGFVCLVAAAILYALAQNR
jgi:hypothetical protein